jgi:hypothetical protein
MGRNRLGSIKSLDMRRPASYAVVRRVPRLRGEETLMKSLASLVSAFLLMSTAHAAIAAGGITITMDDLPLQSVDGLVHPTGVQFGFTVGGLPHPDANYNSGGPGATTFVQDPSIEGTTAGVLSVVFPAPTPIVQFGIARNFNDMIANGASVQLYDASDSLVGVPTSLAMTAMPTFAEAQFNYSGAAVKRMTVDLTTSTDGARFAFDNLTFRPIPEPASILSTMASIVVLLGCTTARCTRPSSGIQRCG